MNEIERLRKRRELEADRDLWRDRAIISSIACASTAFLLLCFGIGQFFF